MLLLLILFLCFTWSCDGFNVTATNISTYIIDGQLNPTLTLVRGETYVFQVVAPFHPFLIKTTKGIGTDNVFSSGVTNNGANNGIITFVVPSNSPDILYYQCQFHPLMVGVLVIADRIVVNSLTNVAYTLNGFPNPSQYLIKGRTYGFLINTTGHPFLIKSSLGSGTIGTYSQGVTRNGAQNGIVLFTVSLDAPKVLYYQCQFHPQMNGVINVIDGWLVRAVSTNSQFSYRFTGSDLPTEGTLQPQLTLYKGYTYGFVIATSTYPFQIQQVPGVPVAAYSQGVVNNSISDGLLVFTVPQSSPSTLYYQSTVDQRMVGTITIIDPCLCTGESLKNVSFYGKNFGSRCSAWDSLECGRLNPNALPGEWCCQSWCFVSPRCLSVKATYTEGGKTYYASYTPCTSDPKLLGMTLFGLNACAWVDKPMGAVVDWNSQPYQPCTCTGQSFKNGYYTPDTYGSKCFPHDLENCGWIHPREQLGSWCCNSWCFVTPHCPLGELYQTTKMYAAVCPNPTGYDTSNYGTCPWTGMWTHGFVDWTVQKNQAPCYYPTFASNPPCESNILNPCPTPDPTYPVLLPLFSEDSTAKIWRIQNQILQQGDEVTKVNVFQNQVIVTKVPCKSSCHIAPCFKAQILGVRPLLAAQLNDDNIISHPRAFVYLLHKAMNIGFLKPTSDDIVLR